MHIPLRLIWKLLLINSMSLLVMLSLVFFSVHWLASSYFMTLLQEDSIDLKNVHQMFLNAVDRYLVISSLAGFTIASLMSMWLSYRLMHPISEIMHSATQISEGDFSHRVHVKGCGEIDQLSLVFNSMAESLEKEEKLRKDFIVDVAHELRTPLTNIRGYMEGLRDKVIVADEAIFDSLHEETLRLVKLVEELLHLARADLAKTNLNVQCFDLAELTQQTLRTFEPRFAEKQLHVSQALQSTVIDADKERLTQVITNLLENALRYSPSGRMIAVSLTKVGPKARFQIANDAEEPMQLLSQPLFERFQRGEKSRSREFGGAGIGLAIVKELIAAHRGNVGYRCDAGKVEFWFELEIK